MANLYSISRCMVGALRHGHHGAVTDEAGWMLVATLVALPHFVSLGASQELIQELIRRERKIRFQTEYRGGDVYVRAVQGWSASSGVNLSQALPLVFSHALPEFLFHATLLQHQHSVISVGLLCVERLRATGGRDRSHVHWFPCESITLLERQHVLKRQKTMLAVVRPKVLQAHGVRMFQAQNQQRGRTGVVLTEVVGPRLFEQILDRSTQRATGSWLEALREELEERQAFLFA
jgi:RNA:NAD 2'-phosphotransferase (TPT1/KptA family)